ncbi:MAG: hypothetical protein FWD15_04845 [Alphaproteobacteria bacterium]|nr:hypothetical protein [Alphaproteobacteria bacterium]
MKNSAAFTKEKFKVIQAISRLGHQIKERLAGKSDNDGMSEEDDLLGLFDNHRSRERQPSLLTEELAKARHIAASGLLDIKIYGALDKAVFDHAAHYVADRQTIARIAFSAAKKNGLYFPLDTVCEKMSQQFMGDSKPSADELKIMVDFLDQTLADGNVVIKNYSSVSRLMIHMMSQPLNHYTHSRRWDNKPGVLETDHKRLAIANDIARCIGSFNDRGGLNKLAPTDLKSYAAQMEKFQAAVYAEKRRIGAAKLAPYLINKPARASAGGYGGGWQAYIDKLIALKDIGRPITTGHIVHALKNLVSAQIASTGNIGRKELEYIENIFKSWKLERADIDSLLSIFSNPKLKGRYADKKYDLVDRLIYDSAIPYEAGISHSKDFLKHGKPTPEQLHYMIQQLYFSSVSPGGFYGLDNYDGLLDFVSELIKKSHDGVYSLEDIINAASKPTAKNDSDDTVFITPWERVGAIVRVDAIAKSLLNQIRTYNIDAKSVQNLKDTIAKFAETTAQVNAALNKKYIDENLDGEPVEEKTDKKKKKSRYNFRSGGSWAEYYEAPSVITQISAHHVPPAKPLSGELSRSKILKSPGNLPPPPTITNAGDDSDKFAFGFFTAPENKPKPSPAPISPAARQALLKLINTNTKHELARIIGADPNTEEGRRALIKLFGHNPVVLRLFKNMAAIRQG